MVGGSALPPPNPPPPGRPLSQIACMPVCDVELGALTFLFTPSVTAGTDGRGGCHHSGSERGYPSPWQAGRVMAVNHRNGRDTACRSARPLLIVARAETVLFEASLRAEFTGSSGQGIAG